MKFILYPLFCVSRLVFTVMPRFWSVRTEGALEPAGHCLRNHVSRIRRGAREAAEQE